MIVKYILSVSVCVLMFQLSSSDECKKIGPCSCQSSNGTIDLTPLTGSAGKAKFADEVGPFGQYFYSWNPCKPFSEGTGSCDNVAVCQSDTTPTFYNLGSQDSANFVNVPLKGLQLTYSATQGGVLRTAYVTLVCDTSQEGSLTIEGEQGIGSFYFTLKSKYACAGGSSGVPNASISAGSIICIIFFSLCFVYLLGGVSYQRFISKASGREMIPNVSLWSSLPGLIRDGILFVVRRGKSTTYDNI